MGASRWLEASMPVGPASQNVRAAIASKHKVTVTTIRFFFIMHLVSVDWDSEP